VQDELQRMNLELQSTKEKIKENQEKIKLNKQLPYLVGNIVEVRSTYSIGLWWKLMLPYLFYVWFRISVGEIVVYLSAMVLVPMQSPVIALL
jgi:ATP-dependent 26S proteasome regulatory subunit